MLKIIFTLLLSVITFFCFGQKYPYQNQSLPVEKRVNDLLKRMTLDEKIAQMANFGAIAVPINEGVISEESIAKAFNGMSYGTMNEAYMTNIKVEDMAKRVNALQD